MTQEQYDLEEQQDFEEEDDSSAEVRLSKELYKVLKSKKQYQKALQKEQSRRQRAKHKATFTRKDNENCYICDNCGKTYKANKGTLIYKLEGEFAYCDACLKVLYPNYHRVDLVGSIKKTDFRDNHCDTWYNKGFK